MRTKPALLLGVALLPAALPAALRAQTITFDEAPAPCLFLDTTPLTNAYAGLGVTFNGSGSIVDACGNFGVGARSGTQFYGFSQSAAPTISFASPISSFSIFAAGGRDPLATFTLTAYDAVLNPVANTVGSVGPGAYVELAVGAAGIRSVSITSSVASYVLDDLTFVAANTTVPEPGTWALLATGLVGLGAVARRQRS